MKNSKLFKIVGLISIIIMLVACMTACNSRDTEYNINFYYEEDVLLGIYNTDGNSEMVLPVDPVKDNCIFDGWYYDFGVWEKPFTSNSLIESPINTNLNIYAKWIEEKVTIKFDTNGGNEIESLILPKNSVLENPLEIPIKEGYKFAGWYYSNNFDYKVSDNVIFNKDEIFYAKWIEEKVTIKFDTNGGNEIENLILPKNSKLEMPLEIPQKDGYEFAGWYYSDDFINQVNNGKILNENAIYYAKWIEEKVTIKFDTNGGNEIESLILPKNSNLELPLEIPIKDGYEFAGWYYSNNFDYKVSNNLILNQDVIFYAKWTKMCTINFDSNGGNNIENQKILSHNSINDLPTPVKEGYKFKGWYCDKIEVQFPYVVLDDVILIAKWAEIFNVTVKDKNDEVLKTLNIAEGENIPYIDYANDSDLEVTSYTLDKNGEKVFEQNLTSDIDLYVCLGTKNIIYELYYGDPNYSIDAHETTSNSLIIPKWYNEKKVTRINNICKSGIYKLNSKQYDELIISNSIKEIEEDAFSGVKTEKIILPDSIEVIGKNAFANSLCNLYYIPEKVKKIEEYAFSIGTSQKEVLIVTPAVERQDGWNENFNYQADFLNRKNIHFIYGAKNAGENNGCLYAINNQNKIILVKNLIKRYSVDLTKLVDGKEIVEVFDNAFECEGKYKEFNKDITSLKISNSIKTIGKYAFSNCKISNLMMSVDNNIENLKEGCFLYSEFTSFKFGKKLKNIGNKAFLSVPLSEINLYNSTQLNNIGEEAFIYCIASSVYIPANVKTIGKNAFYASSDITKGNEVNIYCPLVESPSGWSSEFIKEGRAILHWKDSIKVFNDWEFVENDNGITLICYNGNDKIVQVPKEINGKTVNYIANDSFDNNIVDTIFLPKSIEVLNFYNNNIIIYAEKDIEEYYKFKNYQTPRIYYGLTFKDVKNYNNQFQYFIKNNEITITKYYGKEENIIIPEQIDGIPVVVLGKYMFSGINPKTVKLPKSIKVAQNELFGYFKDCFCVHLQGNLDYIGNSAFVGVKNLYFDGTAEKVEGYGLASDILYLNYEKHPTNWDWQWNQNSVVYYGVQNGDLKIYENSIYLKENNEFILTSVSENINNYEILEQIDDIPVKIIGERAFKKTQVNIEINSNIRLIRNEAFASSSATEIIIPGNIEKIEENAFQNAYNLTIKIKGVKEIPMSWDLNFNPDNRSIIYID